MNPLLVYQQSFLIGLVVLLQAIASALIAVVVLAVFCSVFGQVYGNDYIVLSALVGALTLLLLRLPAELAFRIDDSFWAMLGNILLRWGVVLSVLLLVGFATKLSGEFSRRVLVSWAITTPILCAVAAMGLAALLRRLLLGSKNTRTVVFAGLNDMSRQFAKRIQESPEVCMTVKGFFDDRSTDRLGRLDEFRVLGRLPELVEYVTKNSVSVIFVAIPMRHVTRVMDLLDELRDTTVSIYYLPDVFVFDLIQARTGEILGMPVVAMCETPFYGLRGIVKRLSDIVITIAILVAAAPVMAVVALLVKMTSPGSVLFKQHRYGLDGEEIVVYKFRTMTVSEDGSDFVQAKKDDDRITPIGRVLRKYSLDELPQLLNVLQGRMSLVGPRPHPIALNEQYRKLIKGYMVRHKVPPGLTGLAQINGCRGETAKLEEMQARIDYDLDYLRRWTPLLDVKILFLTVFKIFGDTKAY